MSNFTDPAGLKNLRSLLDRFNAAKEVLLTQEGCPTLSFPRIVVIGDQSHGKSTVISRLTNIQLPSRDGTCTRAPLHIASRMSALNGRKVAQMSFPVAFAKATSHLEGKGWKLKDATGPDGSTGTVQSRRYVKNLLHQDGVAWPPPQESVLQSVEEATLALVGEQQGGTAQMVDDMSNKEILLEWESPDTFTLDVIDLPGLTDLAVNQQPKDMPDRIKDLVKTYIRERDTIILCVFGSDTADLASFKALAAATDADVDPQLKRTLVVFTRVDKLAEDERKERLKQHLRNLFGTYKPLDVALVKNSSNATLAEQQANEDAFLDELVQSGDKTWTNNRNIQMGIKGLLKRLQTLLCEGLVEALPKLRNQLAADIGQTNEVLKKIPAVADPEQAKETVQDLAKLLLERMQHIRFGRHSYITSGKNALERVPDKYLMYKHLEKVHDEWFTEAITVPNYMDADMWEKLYAFYKAQAGMEQTGDISMDVRRSLYESEFARALGEELGKLVEKAASTVQESYDAMINDVFVNYSKLGEEFKYTLNKYVLQPQKEALLAYIKQTVKAQEDFQTRSRIYEASVQYYDKYIRAPTDDKVFTGMLGVEDLVMLQAPAGRKGSGNGQQHQHISVTEALKGHKAAFVDKASHWELNLLRSQWEVLVHTVVVHNSLQDMVPRVVRMFLIHELIDDMVGDYLIKLVGNSDKKLVAKLRERINPAGGAAAASSIGSAIKEAAGGGGDQCGLPNLCDPVWLHQAMVDSDVLRRRQEKEQQLSAMTAALMNLESAGSSRPAQAEGEAQQAVSAADPSSPGTP